MSRRASKRGTQAPAGPGLGPRLASTERPGVQRQVLWWSVVNLGACLGALVLSVVPRLGSRHRPQRWFETASLLAVAAGVGILAIPWVWGESYVVRRPALAVVFAQRPEEL